MPDGDIVHEGLTGVYQKPYMQICEEQFGDEDIARELGDAVWKDARKSSDRLLPFFQEIAARCEWIRENLWFGNIDWQQELNHIEEQKRHIYLDKRWRNLAERACREQISELRNGTFPSNFYTDILDKFMWNTYRANFQERVPLTVAHYKGASPEYLYERLEMMRPFIRDRIRQYVDLIQQHGTFRIPKQPAWRASTSETITIDTDIFSIGR